MSKRLNQYLALATGMSRRDADDAIASGRVEVGGSKAILGQQVGDGDLVSLDGEPVTLKDHQYIMLNKPTGYVSSREKQGNNPTIYELLPENLHHLKSIGRLDKDSSGLLVLTNDGTLANDLMHPSAEKKKQYIVRLDKPLSDKDKAMIEAGIDLDDGPSALELARQGDDWLITMHEGRNRQIRRTFAALSYKVVSLHRISFGKLQLGSLASGKFQPITKEDLL